jgi:hypothetical protein
MLLYTLVVLHHFLTQGAVSAAVLRAERFSLPSGDSVPTDIVSATVVAPLGNAEHARQSLANDLDLFSPVSLPEHDDTTELSILHPRNDIRIEAIKTIGEIVVKSCVTIGPWPCFFSALAGVFAIFFLAYHKQDNVPSSNTGTFHPTKRHNLIDGPKIYLHEAFMPTEACDLACRLQHNAVEDQWTHFGQVHVDGVPHSVHHYRSGNYAGLRAVRLSEVNGTPQGAANFSKREDQEEVNGDVIADYYWNYGNQNAYGAFHSTTDMVNEATTDTINYMQSRGAISACADFVSGSAGPLANGVVTFGWNNKPYGWDSQAQLNSQIDNCDSNEVLRNGGVSDTL